MCDEATGLVLLADPWRVYACDEEGLRWTSERLAPAWNRLVADLGKGTARRSRMH
jgi:hypothetical protein